MAKPEGERYPERQWEAATWAGARREELRRWADLPLEDILRAQEEMHAMANMFGEAGGQDAGPVGDPAGTRVREPDSTYQRDSGGNALPLPGCTPVPLASYLKALGILRLVAEQADPGARGYWEDERFVLESRLDAEGLRRFFLEAYRPTPILAPWNGGSGFYPKDNTEGIGPLEQGRAERLRELRRTIGLSRRMLTDMGLEQRPDGEVKAALLARLRAELPEPALAWLDAAVVLTEDSPKYPPLLGTGGNDGRLDFTNNYMQRLVAVMDADTGEAASGAGGWLEEALFAATRPAMPSAKVGQFAPGNAGGPNQTTGYGTDKPLVNPWDFILMLEGALLFAAAATRRLEGVDQRTASYPFTVLPTGSGAGSTAPGDEGNARAELWAPLWSAPASLAELRSLLTEGRATLGKRPARDGLDFARAVSHLGVDRGITAFQRYAFLMRSGKAYFATPLDRIRVQRNPAADLVDELDSPESGYWLGRFRSHARNEGANRVLSLARRLEDAVFELTTARDDPGPVVRRLLVILGEIQLYLARSPKAREKCPPVPSLSSKWLERAQADESSPEMTLAAALAGLHAKAGENRWALPMRAHLAPEKPGRYPAWAAGDTADHAVTWNAGAPVAANLAATLGRRLLQAGRLDLPDKPLRGARPAPLADVAEWLAGGLDEQRLAALLPGLMLVQIGGGLRPVEREAPLPAAYRLLKPLFSTDEQLRRAGLLPPEASLPLPAGILRRLEADDVGGAVEQGRRRLRASGIRDRLPDVAPGTADGRRLLAALMVPVSDGALRSLLPPTTEAAGEPATPETAE